MHRKTILVVDDDPGFRLLVQKWLQPAYDVLPISDAEDLSDAIESLSPDMVLLDVSMPVVNGIEACRDVRSHGALKDIPVLFLSGSREDGDFINAFEAGGTRWLPKPLSRSALLAAVREEMEKP